LDDPNPLAAFLIEGEQRQNELRAATGLLVNIDLHAGVDKPRICSFVADSEIEIFRRRD
jgi:hypothetical protein